jgi:hypothetical protein
MANNTYKADYELTKQKNDYTLAKQKNDYTLTKQLNDYCFEDASNWKMRENGTIKLTESGPVKEQEG